MVTCVLQGGDDMGSLLKRLLTQSLELMSDLFVFWIGLLSFHGLVGEPLVILGAQIQGWKTNI